MSVNDPKKFEEAIDKEVLEDNDVAVPPSSFDGYNSETNPINSESYPEMLDDANPDIDRVPETKRQKAEKLSAEISRQNLDASLKAEAQGKKKKVAQNYWAVSWNIFRKDKLGMVCLVVVCLLVLIALCAPLLAPYDPDTQNLQAMLQPPSAEHWFGTDNYGRDLFSRVIYGCRVSLSVGVVSQLLALAIGFFAGVAAGYFGGKVDSVISFIIQVFSSFPFLLFAIIVMFVMGPGLANLYVALGLLGWTSMARLVRGDVKRLKGSEYIQACIISGGKPLRIIMRHLLPNCVSTIIVMATLGIPGAIMSEASLSFLGLGVQPPMSSWGQMISASQPYIQSSTYFSVIPGIAIIITVMTFNLLGDAMRDALDPKLRS